MPPAWMWPFEDEIASWFEEITRQRDERMSPNASEDGGGGGMMENELARGRR